MSDTVVSRSGDRQYAEIPQNIDPAFDEPLNLRRSDELTVTSRIDSRVPGV
jgi:hypothetical protein